MARTVLKIFIALLNLWLASVAIAQSANSYEFKSSVQQQQFQHLTEQLRCLVCQNESLWDSNAPLAKDLRGEVYQQVMSGKSDEEIKQYLVARYGQFILFKPALTMANLLLWAVPFLLLIAGLVFVVFIVLRARKNIAKEYKP
jgi:cytochrome c-type biogenesis protein CcmH